MNAGSLTVLIIYTLTTGVCWTCWLKPGPLSVQGNSFMLGSWVMFLLILSVANGFGDNVKVSLRAGLTAGLTEFFVGGFVGILFFGWLFGGSARGGKSEDGE